MECIFCTTEISERAKFCSACKKQVKCLGCSAVLEIDSEICIECGLELKRTTERHQNVIEFSETKNTRTFKASFSNEVGIQISDSLGMIISGKLPSGKRQHSEQTTQKALGSKVNNSDIEDTDFEDVSESKESTSDINKVFKEEDGSYTLEEPRLKAVSRIDYARRLTILFIWAYMQSSADKVPKKALNKIITDASLYDGNWRKWLAKCNLIHSTEDTVTLNIPGKEQAKKYLNDVFDENKIDGWELGTPVRARKKRNKTGDDNS